MCRSCRCSGRSGAARDGAGGLAPAISFSGTRLCTRTGLLLRAAGATVFERPSCSSWGALYQLPRSSQANTKPGLVV
jgi:hypothetical protein